jgi:HD-like signal output (HDOD) protein
MSPPIPRKRDRALSALAHLPPFSPILNRLMASLSQEDVSFARVAELIEKDTVLAGNILALVNSALYGLRGRVHSIRHAVAILGTNALRNAVLSMSVSSLWKKVKTPQEYSMRQFNLNAVAVAFLCDLLARRLQVENADGAFVAGLFHDLGRLLTAIGLPDEYEQLRILYAESETSTLELERRLLGFVLPELSAEALAKWNIPLPIQISVRFQDMPDLDPSPRKGAQIHLSQILHSARGHINRSGIAPSIQAHAEYGLPLESLPLGTRLDSVLTDFGKEFASIKQYL